jgi:hypothetical protein
VEGQNVAHPFAEPGNFTVTLSVWDDHDLQPLHDGHHETDQSTRDVTIINPVGVEPPGVPPNVTALRLAGRNPFRGSAPIRYSLREKGLVSLAIYDVRGALVRQLAHGVQDPGWQDVVWSGEDRAGRKVAAGIYFLRMQASEFRKTVKLAVMN